MAILAAIAVVSGVTMYAVGSGWSRWPTLAHQASGLAVLVLAPWKYAIARRGIRRRGVGRSTMSLLLAVLVVLAVGSGLVHRAGVRGLGSVLVQQVHVGAALASLPVLVWHVRRRPVRLQASDRGRRAVVTGLALLGVSAGASAVLPHAGRAVPTRSLERGSFEPRRMPVTQWLFDAVPMVPRQQWWLTVGQRRWSHEDLLEHVQRHGRELGATLDCTGGWYAHQLWSVVSVRTLAEASDAPLQSSFDARSVTGYTRRFPAAVANGVFVAVAVGGEPLSAGHGAPALIVAPGRRGFWWVKWLSDITPTEAPWWWQPPFPTT